ncbi:MAG: Transcriptional regulatory protein ZraR [Mitsuokella multacida]
MKHIALIAMGRKTSYSCREQLHDLLGSRVNISDYYIEGNLPEKIDADFVVFSSQLSYARARKHVTDNTPFMIARRSINYHAVNKLFEIPTGTNVLLVNDAKSSADDTISLLQTLGIDHLNYYAYYPGMKDPHIAKVAVTPGEAQLVPSSIEKIVDIHTRLIDITSLVELLSRLGILPYYADFLSAKYVRDMVGFIAAGHHYEKESAHLRQEVSRLEEVVTRKHQVERTAAVYHFEDILGQSPKLQEAVRIAKRFAASESTVLIQAESGTGKELFAQSIHNASPRSSGPFVAVNFAAITESLLDSELFGYVEGAFTGASRHGAMGLFERANKGTIFLDEIGDAPLSFQIKLLRVLQEREIRRVGSTTSVHIDVRIIAATNQDLVELIQQGKFRKDLYYRLNILPLSLPSLHERKEDIPLLAASFLRQFKPSLSVQEAEDYFQDILPVLQTYTWPGNIRELQNLVEYLLNICDTGRPQVGDLLPPMRNIYNSGAELTQLCQKAGNLREKVLLLLAESAREGRHLGRRTLASSLHVPESQIRMVCHELVDSGDIALTHGRGGIRLLRPLSDILQRTQNEG